MGRKKLAHTEKIGIIGTGVLGSIIARNFLRKHFSVYVCDLDTSKVKKLTDKGAIACSSPMEITEKADFIFDVTPNDISSRTVWLSNTGILTHATPDKIFIVCSTVSADWVDDLAKRCSTSGLRFFDMAVNGGDKGLIFLCGGDKDILKKIKPVLRGTADKVWYLGPVGHGMRYKLVLNFLQAVHIIGFWQAMKIAKVQQMNVKKVGDLLCIRPGGILTNLAWDLFQDRPDEVGFKIELLTKDLRYAKKLAGSLELNLLDAVLDSYTKEILKGHAKNSWMSIVNLDNE